MNAMWKSRLIHIVCFGLWSVCAIAAAAGEDFAPDRVLVRYKPGAVALQSTSRLGLRLSKQVGRQRTQVFKITNGASVTSMMNMLSEMPGIEAVSPDFKVFPTDFTPNDPKYSSQWYLRKINASAAWTVTTGSSQVKVCIIDSGAQANHPDLAGNIVKGFSTIDGEDPNNFNDDWGHGTHVAGTVAALGNNAVGVTGVAWKASLVICRFMGRNGGYLSNAVECYDKCRQEGAFITTNSYASSWKTKFWESELTAGKEDGKELLVVAAAGNNGLDIDSKPFYPACFQSDNVISVGASTSGDAISGFSNYGRTSVDLFAPGSSILSTWKGSSYQWMQGTSMATPIVAAAAALLQAAAIDAGVTLTNAELKRHLLAGVDQLPAYAGNAVSEGRLNIEGSLKSLEASLAILRGGPVESYTLKQVFFARVWYGCRRWSRLSEAAYKVTVKEILGVEDVTFTCQRVGRTRLKLTASATTPAITLEEAEDLLQQLSKDMRRNTFKSQVKRVARKARPPFKVGNNCIDGVSSCRRRRN